MRIEMRIEMRKENGYTLVELLTALCVASMMMVAIYAAINSAQISSANVERRVTGQQDTRGALELIAMEVAMASYNPNGNNNIWIDAPPNGSCIAGVHTHPDYLGIQYADNNSIAIEMDINGNNLIDGTPNNPNEIIYYNYDAANNQITRSTNCGASLPLLGGTDSTSKTVSVVNASANVPVFTYYDGNNFQLTTPVATPNIIRRIEITLVVDTLYNAGATAQGSSVGTNLKKRVTYMTDVIPRNHLY